MPTGPLRLIVVAFPCGLHDCMAAYLWLLKLYEPKEIILAGDSAGGGARQVRVYGGSHTEGYNRLGCPQQYSGKSESNQPKRMSRQPIVTAEDVKKAIPQPNSNAEETAIRGYTRRDIIAWVVLNNTRERVSQINPRRNQDGACG
jgi:hypothetical protein